MTTTGAGYVSSPQAPSNETPNQNTEGFISESQKTVVKTIAIIQIVLGVLSIVFQSISSAVNYQHLDEKYKFLNTPDSSVYAGIWCGSFFVINGVFGIISTKQKSTAWVNTIIATNSIIVVFAVIQLGFSASAVNEMTGMFSHCRGRKSYDWNLGKWSEETLCDESLKSTATAMDALMIVSSVIYIFLAFFVSRIGCSISCCKPQSGQHVGGQAFYGAGGRRQQGVIISTQTLQQPGAASPPQVGVFTQAGAYPPQAGAYPTQAGAYPPHAGAYPPQSGAYPPQAGAYTPQAGAYPPQAGAYTPQAGAYTPQAGAYPLQAGAYAPQRGAYPPRGGAYSPQETYPTRHDPAGAQAAPPSYESVTAPPAENSGMPTV